MNKFLSISSGIIGSLFIATPLLAQATPESEISEPSTKTAIEKSKVPKWEVDIEPTLLIPLNLDGEVGVEIDEDGDGSDEGGGSGVIEIPIAIEGDSEFNTNLKSESDT